MSAPHTRQAFLIILVAALLLRIPLLFRPAPVFHSRPFIEDAYYSLSVARSLGHGHGLTIDGEHRTNGIQPLIVFLYAPAFAYFNDESALRICLAIDILIELFLILMVRGLMLLLMGRDPTIARRAADISSFLLLFGYASTVYTLNGLETGLAAALGVALVLAYFKIVQVQGARFLTPFGLLGVLGGLTVLARIDTAFLIAILFVLHMFWSPSRHIPFRKRSLQAAVFGAVAVAVSSPWWMYNYLYFGSVTPTSGLSQRVVIPFLENIQALLQYMANKAFVIGYLSYSHGLHPIQIVIVLAGLFVIGLMAVVPRFREKLLRFDLRIRQQWRFMPLVPLLAAIVAMTGYYVLNFGAPHFLQRYLFPGHIVWIVVVGIIAAEMWSRVKLRSAALARFLGATTVVAVLAVFAYPYAWNYSPDKARQNDFLQVSYYIAGEIPSPTRVGMGQSGTAGFFNTNVVNLDGKVNAAVFRANETGRICAYLDSARFDYLIDWKHFFDVLEPCSVTHAYAPVDTVGRFLVYKRLPDISPP